MSELIRVYHELSTKQAQDIVEALIERRVPLIREGEDMRRVLDPTMN